MSSIAIFFFSMQKKKSKSKIVGFCERNTSQHPPSPGAAPGSRQIPGQDQERGLCLAW